MPVEELQHEVVLTAHNSEVRVALLGATVYSWTALGQERYFRSAKSPVRGPTPLRGGIPVVWPCFGPPPEGDPVFAKLQQHGFARSSIWRYVGATDNGVKFSLRPDQAIRDIYEPDFDLLYIVEILNETTIEATLHVTNPSSSDVLRFQALLHNYFLLKPGTHLSDVRVSPLKGIVYKDKVQGYKQCTEASEGATVSGETDRIYRSAGDDLHLTFGDKGIRITKSNLPEVVFWNPDQQKNDAMNDMEPNGYQRFVCVEPGAVDDFVSLRPRATWTGGQTLHVDA